MINRKLLICTQSHALTGGVEHIVNDLCRELPGRGWDALLGLGKGYQFNDVTRYRNTYPDIPIVAIDGTKGTRQSRIESLVSVIQRVKPEIVLSARLFDAYIAVNRIKKRNPGLRFAVTVQTYEPCYFYDMRVFRKMVDLCITSGNMIKHGLIHTSQLPENRVINIPGGVRLPETAVRTRPRLPDQPFRIGYIGRLEQEQKRIFDLIPFLKKMDELCFPYIVDIVGRGPDGDVLKTKARKWVKSGVVVFHGWQKRSDLYSRFYPVSDCLIHFAHTEGVTIAPREAMVHGVVPVISEFIGLKTEGHFIHNMNALTFPVGDIDAAVSHIRTLITQPGVLQRLSSTAMRSQKGVYTHKGSMDAWAHAFDECMLRPPLAGIKIKMASIPDGRLAGYGFPPWLAQRIRNMFGKKFVHPDPGSEWPTQSGWMTAKDQTAILQFAQRYENKLSL